MNASSRKDVMNALSHLVRIAGESYVTPHDPRERTAEQIEIAERNLEMLKTAYHDMNGSQWKVLGEVIGEEIYETLGREGFARRLLLFKSVTSGDIRFRVRKKDVQAWISTAAGSTVPSVAKNYFVYPEEFYNTCAIDIEDRDIAQADTDLLDEKYQDGLEQIMKREDLTLKTLLDQAVGVANDLIYFPVFTPTVFTRLRTSVLRWGIQPVTTSIIAWDLWNDIIANPEFSEWFDPVTKRDLIQDGVLGSILDVSLVTDAFRYSTLRVLQDGEVYMFGPPQTVGGIAERMPLMTKPTDKYDSGIPMRGWFMELIEAMTTSNARAFSKGIRV